tara:strand:- start:7417 stop:8697 length:1281 start_codon:yes stop_codon:yes gene_type:complete
VFYFLSLRPISNEKYGDGGLILDIFSNPNLYKAMGGSFVLTSGLFSVLLLISRSQNQLLKRLFYVPARKSKSNAIQLGGLALGAGIYASLLFCKFFPEFFNVFNAKDIRLIEYFLIAGALINLYGYLDDKIELRPIVKLMGQVSSVVLYATLCSHLLSMHHNQIVFIIICFWGLGVVNGSNLLDGLDTLTLKLGMVSYGTFMFLGAYHNSPKIVICSALFMSCLGAFYFFNREPAKIHLGEIGGSLVGFSTLLLSSFLWQAVRADNFSPVRSGVLAIIPLTLPMVELGVSFLRRVYNKKSPFKGDQLHIHHILNREYGFTPSSVGTIMALGYLITMAGTLYLQILTHPYLALVALIVAQTGICFLIGKKYWNSEDTITITPRSIINFLRKKDVTIIESGQIDSFQLTILKEEIEKAEQEEDDSEAA